MHSACWTAQRNTFKLHISISISGHRHPGRAPWIPSSLLHSMEETPSTDLPMQTFLCRTPFDGASSQPSEVRTTRILIWLRLKSLKGIWSSCRTCRRCYGWQWEDNKSDQLLVDEQTYTCSHVYRIHPERGDKIISTERKKEKKERYDSVN